MTHVFVKWFNDKGRVVGTWEDLLPDDWSPKLSALYRPPDAVRMLVDVALDPA